MLLYRHLNKPVIQCHRYLTSLSAKFNHEGYLTNQTIISENEMSKCREKFNALEATRPSKQFVPQEINLHFTTKFVLDLCIHPRVLEIVQNLLGDNIVLLSSTIFTKYQRKDEKPSEFVGWHQDLKYWGLKSINDQDVKVVSMWLAIDPADADNGAMQFIGKSHKSGFFQHSLSEQEGNILKGNQDMIIPSKWSSETVQTHLLPGQATFHDGMLVHGSKATLNRRRMGLTAQFCQPSLQMVPMTYSDPKAFPVDFRQPVLIQGRDFFGKLKYVKTLEQLKRDAQ